MDRYDRLGEALSLLNLECIRESRPTSTDPPASQPELDKLFKMTGAIIRDRFGGPPIRPDNHETVAVALRIPKTAALFFDRVWSLPCFCDPPPTDIAAYGATDAEIVIGMLGLFLQNEESALHRADMGNTDQSVRETILSFLPRVPDGAPTERLIAEVLQRDLAVAATTLYSSCNSRDRDYTPGDRQALIWALNNIPLVREERLSWDQVAELRRDTSAKMKLRRLFHWMDSEMVGKQVSFIGDHLATKLDDYEWALKKHGLQIATGVLSSIVDPKFLATGAATITALSLTTDGLLGALAGAGLVVGRIALELTKSMIDFEETRRSSHPEVAYLHQLREEVE